MERYLLKVLSILDAIGLALRGTLLISDDLEGDI